MSIATIIKKGRSMSSRVQSTVVECAKDIAGDIWNTFGEDITKEHAQQIAEGIEGDNAAAPRLSEWKAFALAVPFGLVEAITAYDRTKDTPTLTRVRLFNLARAVRKAADYTTVKETVAAFVSDLNKKPTKGVGRTIPQVVKSLFAIQTRKKKEIAFRKALAKLCDEYGIAH